jgi:glutamate-1-semialdehyde aminotransferase
VESLDEEVAALILEPMVFELPQKDFLREVRELCTKKGIVLIFDEMWTGFRLAVGGAQQYFGVTPDLATYSKAMANGMPISALTGRGDIMSALDEKVFFFTTFGGEALSLAAAKATMGEIERLQVPTTLHRLGDHLKIGLIKKIDSLDVPFVKISGASCRTMVSFQDQPNATALELKSFVQQELGKRGILWGGFHNLSYSHTIADLDYAISAYEDVFRHMKSNLREGTLAQKIRGKPVAPVFRRTSQFNLKPKG